MKRTLVVAALALTGATPLVAQTPWIHVTVDGRGEDAAKVNVNLPLSVVRIAMRAAPDDVISDGKIHLQHVDRDIDVETLREMWLELRESGDAELVSVEDTDETVRIRREGNVIRIEVDDRGPEPHDRPERVRVEVPVRVVDALFSGEGESLDIEGAIAELSQARGEIVSVDDGESNVRIWIDAKD